MSIFARIAARYIMPAGAEPVSGRGVIFDTEADALLDAATVNHCIGVADRDSDRADEYGPDQIPAALEHLARADCLIGHNIQGYDLPLLRRLHGWAPKPGCVILDTVIASRLILPGISEIDDQVAAMGGPKLGAKLRGTHKLEAWGIRLGVPKVGADIEDYSKWTPELQARCVGDVKLCKLLYRFLQPAGYSAPALALEHRTAAICDEITAAGVPFDPVAAEELRQKWDARRAELELPLLLQFPGTNLNSRAQIGALLESRG